MKITLFEKETHKFDFDRQENVEFDSDLISAAENEQFNEDYIFNDDWEGNRTVLSPSSATLSPEDYLLILSNLTSRADSDYDYFSIPDRADKILTQPDKIVAIVLGLVAIIADVFSLVVVCRILRTSGGQNSHNALILSLAASDVLFCVTVLLHIANKILNPLYYPGFGDWDKRVQSRCGYTIIKSLNTTALNVTLLNLMGMAIEHYIAILKPLHYTRLLNRKKYTIMILLFWIVALVFGFSDFIMVLKDLKEWNSYKDKFNLCEFVYISDYNEEYTVFFTAFLCLVVMVYVYIRIYIEARRHQRRELAAVNFRSSRKIIVTTLLILGTFMVCWLPMCIFQIVLIIQVHVNPGAVKNLIVILVNADQHLYNLLLLNALLDPIIYAVRIREIRENYADVLRLMCACIYVPFKTRNNPENLFYVSVTNARSLRRMSRRPSYPSSADMERRMSRRPSNFSSGDMERRMSRVSAMIPMNVIPAEVVVEASTELSPFEVMDENGNDVTTAV